MGEGMFHVKHPGKPLGGFPCKGLPLSGGWGLSAVLHGVLQLLVALGGGGEALPGLLGEGVLQAIRLQGGDGLLAGLVVPGGELLLQLIEKVQSLKDKDFYPMLDIITATLPDDLADVFVQLATGEKSVDEIGGMVVYKIAVSVLKNVSAIPDKIYPLLSDLSGIPADEIPEMPFGTTPSMIWDIIADAKNASFFRALSKLL